MARLEDEIEVKERQMANLLRDLSPLIPFFDDKNVTNVYVYGDGRVQYETIARGITTAAFTLSVPERLRIIYSLSSVQGVPIDKWMRPTLESVIPDYNIRTTAILPPWTKFPEITFRRPAEKIWKLEEYIENSRLTKKLYDKIVAHIEKRSNIVISGSTGSGKTTFTNALIAKMVEFTPDERFYIVEDTPELQCAAKNTTQLYIRKEQAVLSIENALRWTPQRIIFGELRSGETAVSLLEAWNTGHPGNVTTIHADSAASTISRIEGLLRQKIQGELSHLLFPIGLIIHLSAKTGFGPFVDEALTIDEIRRDLK
jgi:type IV secretion system protein VirB11